MKSRIEDVKDRPSGFSGRNRKRPERDNRKNKNKIVSPVSPYAGANIRYETRTQDGGGRNGNGEEILGFPLVVIHRYNRRYNARRASVIIFLVTTVLAVQK